MSRTLRNAERSVAALLTLASVWLHCLAAASRGGLWRDEANTVGLATLPAVSDIWINLQYDSFPILWPLILRELSALTGPLNDTAFRIVGLCIGLALVAVLWLNARAFGHRYPLVSLAIFALAPSVIVWGDSIRAYGFGMLLILLSGVLLWRFVERPNAARFIAAAIASIASVHTLFYGALTLLAFCAGAAAVCASEKAWKKGGLVVLMGAMAACSMFPYYASFRDASSWNMLVQMPDYSFGRFSAMLTETLRPGGPWTEIVWGELFAVGIFAGVRALRSRGDPPLPSDQRSVLIFCLVALAVGVPAHFLFLNALSYYTAPWYYLTLLALVAVCLDGLFGTLARTPGWRVARLVGALVLGAAAFFHGTKAVQTRLTNIDIASSRLREIGTPKDLVLVNPWYYGVTFNRYYHGASPWMTVPPLGYHRFHRYDIVKQKMMAIDQTMPVREAIERSAAALRTGNRVFFVGNLAFPPPGKPPRVLPPAPVPGAGWPTPDYDAQWGTMVEHFLRERAANLTTLPMVVSGSVSPFENVSVLVASGWRN